jgi:glucokinase
VSRTQGLAHGEPRYAIGLDIGGTKIAGAVVTGEGTVVEHIVTPTPPGADGAGTVALLCEMVGRLRKRCPGVEAIGVGAAGMVDWPSGHIRWAPNNAYRNLPLRQMLGEATALPTVVENDANAAAWAEARVGAGVGRHDLAVFTVGTGVGGGLVLGGSLYRGRTGIGAEVGHIVVNPGGDRCGCGISGCLEAMASGSALGRFGRAAASADPNGCLASLAGGHRAVTGETVYTAAIGGDRTALALFERLGYWLGIGIASVVSLLDVELVIITGGLVKTGSLLIDPTRASFERFLFARDRRDPPPILQAMLGTEAGVVGAALLALDTVTTRPEAAPHRPGGSASEPGRDAAAPHQPGTAAGKTAAL